MTRPIRLTAGRTVCGSAVAVRTSSRRWVGLAAKAEPSCKRLGASLRACVGGGLASVALFRFSPKEFAASIANATATTAADVAATVWPRRLE